MNLNKTLLATIIAFGSVSMAHANEGSGKITFVGSIIDAPCSIAAGSDTQTIELGEISKAVLETQEGKGQSKPKNFNVTLENCSFGEDGAKNKVSVTFSGPKSSSQLLGITGSAKGASVAITDGSGKLIELDKATDGQVLQEGTSNTLSFAAYVKGDGAADGITEGDFQAVADFTLAYN